MITGAFAIFVEEGADSHALRIELAKGVEREVHLYDALIQIFLEQVSYDPSILGWYTEHFLRKSVFGVIYGKFPHNV